ncbi:MAG: RNA methyltransferase [Negativicutes bacterium]|nr:RNA methyltransferase [Negativicutes bacterium]
MQDLLSMQNPLIQEMRKLRQKKARRQSNLFLCEGIRSLEAAYSAAAQFDTLFVTAAALEKARIAGFCRQLSGAGVPVYRVSQRIIEALSQTETSQGIVAAIAPARHPLQELQAAMRILLLDRVQDPGNAGTALRSAAAFGFAAVVFLPGSVDPWSDKVIRASAGSIFQLLVMEAESEAAIIRRLQELHLPLVATALTGGIALADQPWLKQPLALAVGNEGQGISDSLLQAADYRLTIPMIGPAESLNVAVATGILLFKMMPNQP